MTLNLYRDANGSPLPQSVDDNGNVTVYATGDTTGVEFCKTKLLRDCSGAVIPNQIYDVAQGKWVIDTSGGGGGGGGGGGITLPISANNVTDSSTRVLLSPEQRGQITANATELNSHSQRLSSLENEIANVSSTDELVKLNANGQAQYLESFLDGYTIAVSNEKLQVPFVASLMVTPQEINTLTGVNGNIQEQINSLSSVTGMQEIVDTEFDLPSTVPPTGTILVRRDSTQGGSSTFYVSNGSQWVFGNTINTSLARDFTTNPISLSSEVAGFLSKNNYEKQNASETSIQDAAGNLTATNVEDAIAELFTYANNIKSIASVIGSPLSVSDTSAQLNAGMQQLKVNFANNLVEKGVIAYPYNTVDEMIQKVLSIPNITLSGTVKKITKLNITAPYELNIVLDEPLQLNDITTTPIEFVQGPSGVVHYDVGFDNGDSTDFQENRKVLFDGTMRLKTSYNLPMQKDENWNSEGELNTVSINTNDYLSANKINVTRYN